MSPTTVEDKAGVVRLALVACDGLLGEVIRYMIGQQPDMCVVLDLPNADGLAMDVFESHPDVVIWNLGPSRDDASLAGLSTVFGTLVRTRVLATFGDGRSGAL